MSSSIRSGCVWIFTYSQAAPECPAPARRGYATGPGGPCRGDGTPRVAWRRAAHDLVGVPADQSEPRAAAGSVRPRARRVEVGAQEWTWNGSSRFSRRLRSSSRAPRWPGSASGTRHSCRARHVPSSCRHPGGRSSALSRQRAGARRCARNAPAAGTAAGGRTAPSRTRSTRPLRRAAGERGNGPAAAGCLFSANAENTCGSITCPLDRLTKCRRSRVAMTARSSTVIGASSRPRCSPRERTSGRYCRDAADVLGVRERAGGKDNWTGRAPVSRWARPGRPLSDRNQWR